MPYGPVVHASAELAERVRRRTGRGKGVPFPSSPNMEMTDGQASINNNAYFNRAASKGLSQKALPCEGDEEIRGRKQEYELEIEEREN